MKAIRIPVFVLAVLLIATVFALLVVTSNRFL